MNKNKKSQSDQLKRLCGQLTGVGRMIEEDKSLCLILQQLEAVRGNIKSLEKKLLNSNMPNNLNEDVKKTLSYILKIS
jgi:DNA-binding FrmR family transcriptional regulator